MSDSRTVLNVNNRKISKSVNDQKESTTAPFKYIVLSTATTGIYNSVVSNSTPLYLVLPKIHQGEVNQNLEIITTVNNPNLTINHLNTSALTNTTNNIRTIPILTSSSKVMNNQIPNTVHPNAVQHISLPIVSIVNLPPNSEASNVPYNPCSTYINNPIIQPAAKNVNHVHVPPHASIANINILPSLPQINIKSGSVRMASDSQGSYSNINVTTVPIAVLPNSTTLYRNSEANQHNLNTATVLVSGYASQPSRMVYSLRPQKIKPIKCISLGKDKNAIQQISIPLKMDSLVDMLSSAHHNLGKSSNSNNLNLLNTQQTEQQITRENDIALNYQKQQTSANQRQIVNKNDGEFFTCGPLKKNAGEMVVKRNLITNEVEVMNKNQFLNAQCSAYISSTNTNLNKNLNVKSFIDKRNSSTSVSSQLGIRAKGTGDGVSNSEIRANESNEENIYSSINSMSSNSLASNSKLQASDRTKNSLTMLQELFPPPISMIPVSVMPPVQAVSKPSVLVMKSLNETSIESSQSKTQKKTTAKKTVMTKCKKLGRKTVRQLLEERYKHETTDGMGEMYKPRGEIRTLRPIYRLAGNRTLISTALKDIGEKNSDEFKNDILNDGIQKIDNDTDNSLKRPNIMLLPSAKKIFQNNTSQEDAGNKDSDIKNFTGFPETNYKILDAASDFLRDNVIKDFKSKYYDMSELRIGYFQVEDNVDASGRFRSKFKVFFTKRQFVYEFPVTKCNQVALSSGYSSEQIIRIEVPFTSLVALNMRNRHITLQVSFYPRICFKRNQDRSGLTSKESNYSEEENLWSETSQNSLFHEILLRRSQADDLKLLLCNFDSNFIFLFDMGNDIESSLTNVLSQSEDDLESENLGKIYPKNKKNLIRRLPQWDSETLFEPIDLMKSDQLLTGNQICSCRISCKSLRCSCVKAAKSCGTEGSVCLCTNCDNPLNVLDSFGINLDFSLNDSCLFQNIYRIAKLRNFLLKCVKLSCCNTVARVLDCIPGTILCPNSECNESLEFSWCQFIICYPERNPRNHCSFCGLCCFSNKRHCPICNRCYMVSPKSPDCPNCRGCGFAMEPINHDLIMQDSYLYSQPLIETLSMKSCSKPEIILLDSSGNVKLGDSSGEQECSTSLKSKEINNGIYSQNGDKKSELQGRLKEEKQLEKENANSKEDNCKIYTENARKELATASQNVKISAVNTNSASS